MPSIALSRGNLANARIPNSSSDSPRKVDENKFEDQKETGSNLNPDLQGVRKFPRRVKDKDSFWEVEDTRMDIESKV